MTYTMEHLGLSGCQVLSRICSLLIMTLSYHQQSKHGCRNNLQLLPCKGSQLLKEPEVVFKQYRCIKYIMLLLSLGALWKCLALLFFC